MLNWLQNLFAAAKDGQALAPIAEPAPVELKFDNGPVELAARRSGSAVIVEPLPIYNQTLRIGGHLTPVQVSQIIREADTGDVWRLMDLANEARQKDCHLHGILFTRETNLSACKWQVKPYIKRGRKRATARDQKIAEFVEDAVKGAIGGSSAGNTPGAQFADFRGLLAHMGGAIYYGFSVAETIWKKDGDTLVPATFSLLQPRRFHFRLDDGQLCWWDQSSGMAKPVDFQADYAAGKFIVHQPRIVGDTPCREGLVRPLMWAALFRNWTIRDWLKLAELAWKPYRTGTYQKGASKEDIDNLISALRQLTTSGAAAFPETTNFKVDWPKNAVSSGQSMHGELAAFMAAEMSKAVLGQTMTTEAGNKGARSLGEVHDKVRGDISEADCKSAQGTLQSQLVVPMVRMNFGSAANMPCFEIITDETEAIKDFSIGVKNLQSAGLKMKADWVRDRIGSPTPGKDDEVLEPTVAPAPPSDGSDGQPAPTDDPPEETPEAADEEPADEAA